MENTTTTESAGTCGQSSDSADNMRTTAPDYGEPWKFSQGEPSIESRDDDAVLTGIDYEMDDAKIQRAVSCVNTCAGMVDPVKEITAMREALKEAHKIIQVLYMDALDHHKESWPRANEWMEKHAAFATQEP